MGRWWASPISEERPEMAPFEINNDQLTINVPAGQFTDALIDGWQITPGGAHAGRLDVVPWSENQIAAYHQRLRTHRRYGLRLLRLYRWLDPTEGRWRDANDEAEREPVRVRLAAALARRFVIRRPPDRGKTLTNCMVLGSDTATGIRLKT
jgi:hypothetical protein